MFKVLINDVVKKLLLQLPAAKRRRFREKLEFLENGIWDGGLRVKKLKGFSPHCLFEGRLDAGNRILFTLGREPDPGGAAQSVAYVWGVAHHDAVNRESQAIIPDDVPWLRFQTLTESALEDPELEGLDSSHFTQESISERLADDSAAQRWHPVAEAEWARIRGYQADDFELFLHLTPDQSRVLSRPLPILLSGTAGSGKTTLGVYYLFHPALKARPKLFVTYNRHLRNYAEHLYRALLNTYEGASALVEPDFRTFRDLCLDIASRRGRSFLPEKEVTYHHFGKLIAAHPPSQKMDVALLWEEIRSIIKGALPPVNPAALTRGLRDMRGRSLDEGGLRALQDQYLIFANLDSGRSLEKSVRKHLNTDLAGFAKNLGRHVATRPDDVLAVLEATQDLLHRQKDLTRKKHLSFLEYELLGKKKAPNFQYNRKSIYAAFEWYQAKLEENGGWDEPDLAREAAALCANGPLDHPPYGAVICDEVQDLTDTQHGMLFSLVSNPYHLFFAGDTKQIVNPSGFRWEELKRHFFERGLSVPVLASLALNFRSSGSIVELANTLLELKESILGVSSEQTRETWKYQGRPPAVAQGVPEEEFLGLVRQAGARRTILVRSEEERSRLARELDTELVFTIAEAKGLEFTTVVLWKFTADPLAQDTWASILGQSDRLAHAAWVRHEINLLYVAVTRAQKDLIVYDGPEVSEIWAHPAIADKVFPTGEQAYLENLWNTLSSPEEWISQGRYYLEREHFKAAMECFRNGGDDRSFALAGAGFFEREGRWGESAAQYEVLGERAKAAELYQRAGCFDQALALWQALRNPSQAQECQLAIFRRDGNHLGQAEIFLERKAFQDAAEAFVRAREHSRAADLYAKKVKDLRKAVPCYEAAGRLAEAAAACARLRLFERAGGLYERLKDLDQAEKMWVKGQCIERLLQHYRSIGRTDRLLALYEQKGRFDQALKLLSAVSGANSAPLAAEADRLLKTRKFQAALIRFQAIGDLEGQGQCRMALKQFPEAAELFAKAGNHLAAAQAWAKARQPERAAESFLQCPADDPKAFQGLAQIIKKDFLSRDTWVMKLGQTLFTNRQHRQAARLFAAAGDPFNEGCCLAGAGDDAGAAACWERMELVDYFPTLLQFGLDTNIIRPVARYIVNKQLSPEPFLPYLTFKQETFENMLSLVTRYFRENRYDSRRRDWYRSVLLMDQFGRHWKTLLADLESAREFSLAASHLHRISLTTNKRREIAQELENSLALLPPDKNLEAQALRFQFLKRREEQAKVLESVPLVAENAVLFAGTPRYLAAFEFCRETQAADEASCILEISQDYPRLAAWLESLGRAWEAGHNYERAGDFSNAGRLFELANIPEHAADCFVKAGDLRRAREILSGLKGKKPRAHLAKLCEKMGDYPAALEIWRELGKDKDSQRCVKAMQKTHY